MKKTISLFLLMALTSCATKPIPQIDYSNIGQRLLITFIDNPNTPKNMCNPIIEAAYQSSEQAMPLDIKAHINVNDEHDIGLVMLPSRQSGLLIGRSPMSSEGGFKGSCKQMHLRLSKLQCWNSNGTEKVTCPPNKKTDGLRRFGYVGVNY